MERHLIVPCASAATLALAGAAAMVSPAVANNGRSGYSQNAPTGVTLQQGRETITSALRVDLTRDFATLPLHKGTARGRTVWYVITDTSNAKAARRLGVNHSPKLLNATRECPACVQEVRSRRGLLGSAPVRFQGAPDFRPMRTLTPGSSKPFPPRSFTAGAVARAGYSPYVRVKGHRTVFNAPIVATGNGPFDITTHTNTHDRTLGIDTRRMTTDHLFVRGFANGKSILYLSFESSDAFTATVERSTFVPGLVDLAFANGGGRLDSGRASIFTFVNAKTGLERDSGRRGASQGPGRSQGLTHALSLGIVGRDAAVSNPRVLEALARGADVSNIFDVFPTNTLPADRREYSPIWDLQVGVYSDPAVAQGMNGLKTDANDVRRLAAENVITAPGGLPLGSANVIINGPALAFLTSAPTGPRLPLLPLPVTP